jgi:homeobox-leucine zipper protein
MVCRTKLKQTEVDCEYLKRWCERLTDENKRLQKEVAELRALKAASASVIPPPASMTTLAMCPSCQRVSNSSKGSSLFTGNSASPATPATAVTASSQQAALSNYCQFFPVSGGSNQNMWTSTNARHTRELF